MFYLTLPSNNSLQYYPNNTLTHFVTQLAHPINLHGSWEVGLAEIQYPHTWCNLTEEWLKELTRSERKDYQVPVGQYETPQQLVQTLNGLTEHFTFSYDQATNRIALAVPYDRALQMSSHLASMLGLPRASFGPGTHHGTGLVDMNQGFYSLYVYCNIVEPRLVGDTEVPLLRIVPIEGQNGQMVTKTYEQIQYIPLLQKNFDHLEIDIKKDTGESVPFEFGKVVVTLHFREKRPYF